MSETFIDRHYYLFRRLHSLTGIAPAGVFLMVHLTTNSSIIWGRFAGAPDGVDGGVATFQHEVNFIHSLPFLLLIEIFGLWLPIAFHAVLGVYYATTGKGNTGRYKYTDNFRYALQRLSGYFGILFILYHVATLRWGWTFLVPGGTEWSAEYAASTLAAAMQGGTEGIEPLGYAVGAFYFLGVSLLVFHLANGLWTAAITWGLTITAKAQRRWGVICAGLGTALMLASWAAIFGFMTLDPVEARYSEDHVASPHTPAPTVVQEDE